MVLLEDLEREAIQVCDEHSQPAGVCEPGFVVLPLLRAERPVDRLVVEIAGLLDRGTVQAGRITVTCVVVLAAGVVAHGH
jgi:hypothetical protein